MNIMTKSVIKSKMKTVIFGIIVFAISYWITGKIYVKPADKKKDE